MHELFWIFGYKFWDEFFRIASSVYLLFDVIFFEFTTVCVLSFDLLINHDLLVIGNHFNLLGEVSIVLLCC